MRELLLRGMLAGVIAGILAVGFATVFGEPPIERAIAFEEQSALGDGHAAPGGHTSAAAEAAPVPRSVQRTAGLSVGMLGLGVAFGGIVAIAFAFARGRLGAMSDDATALTVALLAFLAMYLVPFLKYPANPPAAGDPETIQARTAAYVAMLLLSVLVTIGAVILQRRLARGHSSWDATLMATAAFGIASIAVGLLMPSFAEVPDAFPADTLWRFRLASMGTQLVLWLGIGLAFGMLTERAARARR